MLDSPEFERWQRAADDALTGAEAQREAGPANWACFIAEQAAQLSCKGLLHGVGVEAWGQDLVDLGDRVSRTIGTDLEDDVASALRRLSRHYIPARYPDAHPSGAPGAHYGRDDADQAIADAERVLMAVRTAWDDLKAGMDDAARGPEGPSEGAT